MKDLVIAKKNYNDLIIDNVGNYNSDDRFYSYLNQEIENKLKQSNKFIKIIIDYLFSSSNYKHDPNLKKRFSLGSFFLDLFCILCIIGFIACLIAGVLTPLISFLKSSAPEKKLILSTSQWILTAFAILFMIISIFYFILVFKFRNVNKGLQLQVYVQQKLNTILNLKNFFKLKKIIIKKDQNFVKKSTKLILLDNAQYFSMNTIWLSAQILNLMIYLFDDTSISICLRNMSDIEKDSWFKIINSDFENLTLIIKEPENNQLTQTTPSYSTANYYGLQVNKSAFWSYIFTLLFAGIFGSTITSFI